MLFWSLIITICLLALLPVAIGLLRQHRNTIATADYDRMLFEARIAEIGTDYQLGRIDAEAMEVAKAEESRKLIRLSEQQENGVGQSSSFGVTGAFLAVIILIVPLGSIWAYNIIGTPPAVKVADNEQSQQPPSMEDLLAAAEARLEKNPDEAQGWRVIAPVYMRLRRFEDAQKAFANLIRLEGETPELLLGLAEARILSANNEIDDQAIDNINKVLDAQPENARARFLLGAAMLQRGKENEARTIWQNMLDGATGDEPWYNAVRTNLAALNDEPAPASRPGFTPEQLEQVNAMVSGLAQRLSEEKGSHEDWERLIRSYIVLDRRQEALAAFERASELFAGEQEFLSSLNDMITGEGAQ